CVDPCNLIVGIVRADGARTRIQGNWVGLDALGTKALDYPDPGLYLLDTVIVDLAESTDTVVGGVTSLPGTALGNVISPSFGNAVRAGRGTHVAGNIIGLTAKGDTIPAGSNGKNFADRIGIYVPGEARGVVIGGAAGEGNVISGYGWLGDQRNAFSVHSGAIYV